MKTQIRIFTLFLSTVLLVTGCADKEKQKLQRGVDFARAQIEKIGRDQLATVSFQSLVETGGDIQHYLSACVAEPAAFPGFCRDKPSAPWTVVIKDGPGPSDYTIEGYGDDLAKPLMTAIAVTSYQKPAPLPENINGEPGQDPPITVAAADGKADVVRTLINKGANVNAMSVEGATALMYASARGHVEVVKALVATNVDVTVKANNKQGWSALMCAVSGGSPEIVKLLLDKGANADEKVTEDQTPLMNAAATGNKDIIILLIKGGAKLDNKEKMNGNSALMLAVNKRHIEAVTALLNAGADINITDKNGLTSVIIAASGGYDDILRELIARKANLNAKTTGGNGIGSTALMQAAAKGEKAVVELLLKSGAEVEAVDSNGNNALRYAEHNGRTEIADLLRTAKTVTSPVKPAARPPAQAASVPAAGGGRAAVQTGAEALIGKTAKDAEALYGKPMGKMNKGGTVIMLFNDAEVHLKNGKIVDVFKK